VLEERNRRQRQFLALALEPSRALSADREEHRVEVPAKLVERDVGAEPDAHPELAASVRMTSTSCASTSCGSLNAGMP